MSGVPSTPPPGPPGPGPSPPPPYGPPYFPYPYYPPPPKRDNLALIIVLLVVLFVLVPVIFAAILYVMVSGLISNPTMGPIVAFVVDQTGGNATISVSGASREISPSELRLRLEANGSSSGIAAMPPPDGSVALAIGSTAYRIFWLDQDHDATFGVGDALWVTGNLAPLRPSTSYALFLLGSGGATISAAAWTTA